MKRAGAALRRSFDGDARLWQVWWLGGIPVALSASAFTVAAELARDAGQNGGGALLDTVKLMIYLAWFCAAWRCAGNVGHPLWTRIARCAIAGGLLLTAITF